MNRSPKEQGVNLHKNITTVRCKRQFNCIFTRLANRGMMLPKNKEATS